MSMAGKLLQQQLIKNPKKAKKKNKKKHTATTTATKNAAPTSIIKAEAETPPVNDPKKTLEILEAESEEGHPEASYQLALHYLNGVSGILLPDIKGGLDLLEKAAKEGSYEAALLLAEIYDQGKYNIKIEHEKTFYYANMANMIVSHEDLYISKVMNRLANCYYYGKGTAQSEAIAQSIYHNAANLDDPEAQYRMAVFCEKDGFEGETLTRKDLAKSLMWRKKAAEGGHTIAQYELGCHYMKTLAMESRKKAFDNFLKASKANHMSATKELITCYLEGIGTEQNVKLARELIISLEAKKETKETCESAQFQLFICDMLESLQKQDLQNVSNWILQLKKHKTQFPAADNYLFEIYEKGIGIPVNIAEAAKIIFYETPKTAFLQCKKGYYFEHALGGFSLDLQMAFSCYQYAADEGHLMAGYHLALCYLYGKGTVVDLKKAYQLFEIVGSNGMAEEGGMGMDLCHLLGCDSKADIEKINLERLHQKADNGNKEIAYVLSKYYLNSDLSKAIHYFWIADSLFDLESYKVFMRAFVSERQKLTSARVEVEQEIQDLKSSITALKRQHIQEQESMRVQGNELQKQLACEKLKLQAVKDEHAKEKVVSKRVNEELSKLQSKERKLRNTAEQQSKRLEKLQGETRKQQEEMESLQASYQALQTKQSEVISERDSLKAEKAEIAKLNKKIAEIEKGLKDKDDIISEKDRALNDKIGAITLKDRTISEKDKAFNDLKNKFNAEAREKNTAVLQRIKAEQDMDLMQKKLNALEEELAQRQKEESGLRLNIRYKEEELKSLTRKMSGAIEVEKSNAKQAQTNLLLALAKERETLKQLELAKQAELKAQIESQDLLTQIASQNKQLSTLSAELQASKTEKSQFAQKMAALEQQNAQVIAANHEFNNRLLAAQENIRQLNPQFKPIPITGHLIPFIPSQGVATTAQHISTTVSQQQMNVVSPIYRQTMAVVPAAEPVMSYNPVANGSMASTKGSTLVPVTAPIILRPLPFVMGSNGQWQQKG